MTDSPEEPWMGTLDVAPLPGNTFLGDAIGAIVNVLAVTSSPRGFRRKVYEHMGHLQFEILNITDAEPLELRLEFIELEPELKLLVPQVRMSKATATGSYQAYTTDDED